MARGVNSKDLNSAILSDSKVKKKFMLVAQKKLNLAKAKLIDDFVSHPVSQEIKGGASAGNVSGTLGGYGNLFSFIGFESGNSPVDKWIRFLESKIKINESRSSKYSDNDTVGFRFEVDGVSDGDFTSVSPMPWEPGRSWIKAIEQGISGFSFYISKKLGRSGGGVQSNHRVRSGQYSRTKYWTSIWKKFLTNLE
jgi:hypothetical protein